MDAAQQASEPPTTPRPILPTYSLPPSIRCLNGEKGVNGENPSATELDKQAVGGGKREEGGGFKVMRHVVEVFGTKPAWTGILASLCSHALGYRQNFWQR
ncbi:hypothetical protein HPB50_028602 [Hyalomma asiaticum]|nr:hypothetical protein HPB50_028602 [Hyalomma asiaticum]